MNLEATKSKVRGAVKAYARVESRSRPGVKHIVVYIRTKLFRGWLCQCENFLFDAAGRNRNCDHIKAVRQKYGRFAGRLA